MNCMIQNCLLLTNGMVNGEFQLIERVQQYSPLVIVAIVLCFALLSVARITQRNVFLVLFSGIWNFENIDELNRKGIRKSPMVSNILLIHFFVVSSVLCFISFFFKKNDISALDFLIIIAPSLIVFYQTFIIRIISSLFKAKFIGEEINFLTSSLTQIAGIFLLCALVVVYFQPDLFVYTKSITVITILSFFIIRILRGIFHAFTEGIRWYYIILYLWTVEILPVLVCLKLILGTNTLEY